jgi:hypothetical protein
VRGLESVKGRDERKALFTAIDKLRQLGPKLGPPITVSQPRIARMESGEHNPDVDTIIATVDKLGTEFVLDVAPAERGARLVTKGAQTAGAVVRHGNVAVTTASRTSR